MNIVFDEIFQLKKKLTRFIIFWHFLRSFYW